MSGIVTLGIDLAKNVFALHGVDGAGKPVPVRPNVARSALVEVVDFRAACREPANAIRHAGRDGSSKHPPQSRIHVCNRTRLAGVEAKASVG